MQDNELPLVSIYTCVYNGEKTLYRVFNSIKNLDYPNIEHIIVNDGSIDKTDELITEYIKDATCPVKYIKKENGGKHTALNIVWDIAEGFFLIQLDADDELLPHSIRFLVNKYYNIPEDIRDQYWCVHGRCITQHGDFVGDKYPDNINNFNWKEAERIAAKCSGEKIGIQRRDYLTMYKFPLVPCVSHVPENVVWDQIDNKYGTYYTNEVVRVYYVGEGGNLTDKKRTRKQFNPTTYKFKFKVINENLYGKSYKNIFLYSFCFFISSKDFQKANKYYKDINKHKFLLTVLAPFTWFLATFYRLIKRIK
ncbi:MAG: glycosyltransferase family 2 protein [Erysipelotrichales bacterium]|nr:glycosyltransferase family 2 protein [Erysipelotrichales bacterium]